MIYGFYFQASGKVESIIECWGISIWRSIFISKVENEICRNRQFVTTDRSLILKFTECIMEFQLQTVAKFSKLIRSEYESNFSS